MNILITGIAGFIGSHTAEFLLKTGHTVVGVDNFAPYYSPKLKELNASDVERAGGVIHCINQVHIALLGKV
ncbi:MAG: GDP-mannose 4,6-dehydratase [Candidatus Kerfeldbacteria bacterium]|nr:GDP-mannose 4,6-dehydratase [Candidatus Kerfeldbacteria bacterium]